MAERHVTEFFAEVFRRAGMKRNMKRAEAVLLWPRVVGADVARFSSARALREGILYVDVSDSETAMHLSMQRSRFLGEYRSTYGVTDVREIRFQVGRVTKQAAQAEEAGPAAPDMERVDPQELARIARDLEALQLPDEVAQVTLQAGRSFLALQAARRAAGWTPCPTCGALHDGAVRPLTPREEALQEVGRSEEGVDLARELCAACARYAQEGRVRAAATRVMLEPNADEPGLSVEERAVAGHLAARRLDAHLRELMPAVALNPAMLPQLDRAARCRVALALGVAPTAVSHADLAAFDPRITQLLRNHDPGT